MSCTLTLYECPTCGAKEGKPCRTPKGRKKPNVHDTRPFGISFTILDKKNLTPN